MKITMWGDVGVGGVGVTLEVRLHCLAAGVNGAGKAVKILGYVARVEEFENAGVEPRGPSERAPKNFEKLVL